MTLAEIRARHYPVEAAQDLRLPPNLMCVFDLKPYPCDAARLLAEVDRLRDWITSLDPQATFDD